MKIDRKITKKITELIKDFKIIVYSKNPYRADCSWRIETISNIDMVHWVFYYKNYIFTIPKILFRIINYEIKF